MISYELKLTVSFTASKLAIILKIFIDVFTFLYVKGNSKEVGEEIMFPSFFRNILMSAFLLRFKANYLAKCVATPIFLFGFQ